MPVIHKLLLSNTAIGNWFHAGATVSVKTKPIEKVLSLQVQYRNPCLWVQVDEDAPDTVVQFVAVPTGRSITDFTDASVEYVGTALLAEGNYVLHYYMIL